MKRVLLALVMTLVVFIVTAFLLGLSAPVDHVATVSLMVDQPEASVWRAVHDISQWSSWRPSIDSAESLGDGRWRLRGADGTITYRVESPNDGVLVSTILDDHLPFGGRWIWSVSVVEGATLVVVREEGHVSSALFRFFAKYVFGHETSIVGALSDLEAHLTDR